MDALEILIRDTLAEHAEQAPPMTGRVPRNAHASRRWLYATAAAAAVAVIAVGGVVIARRSGPDGSAAASTPPTAQVPVPPGTKPVSFHGISLDVPRELRIGAEPCSPGPVANVVNVGDPTAQTSCGALAANPHPKPVGGVEVSLAPLVATAGPGRTNVTVDGSPGYRHYFRVPARYTGITGGLTLADLAVEINVTAPTRAAVDRILDTVHLTPIDYLGCAATVPSLTPRHNPPADSLVPGHPISAVACGYAPDQNAGRSDESTAPVNWLYESARVPAASVVRLAGELASTPTEDGPGDLADDGSGSATWIVFSYADGSTRTVAVANHEEGAPVSDGNRNGGAGDDLDGSALLSPS